tara:strand:+ start:25656 stop:26099 length:444 start_codon:yes stop_codon:yes gene_type:complete
MRKVVTDLTALSKPTEMVKGTHLSHPYLKVINDIRMYLMRHQKTAVGISANQLGFTYAIAGFWETQTKITIMVNPKIITQTDETSTSKEMCLSLPNEEMEVARYNEVLVDCKNWKEARTFRGFTSKVVQHEIDHLQGITIKDRHNEL